ncbi:hypothetical protein CANARDRAFT_184056, partial [[Candida] arabinofermentans NRRL YB-2248]
FSAKSSDLSVTLPLFELNQRLIYLPGITYRTIFTKDDSLDILMKFRDFIQHNSTRSLRLLNKGNKMVLGCLPGYNYDGADTRKVATICQITEIHEVNDKIVISFKAITRGLVLDHMRETNEARFDINLDVNDMSVKGISNKCLELIPSIIELFDNIEEFIHNYTHDPSATIPEKDDVKSESHDDQLKYVLLKLSPLSNLLYTQLSSNESTQGFARLERLFKSYSKSKDGSNEKRFFQYMDVLTALFPFSIKQKVEFLSVLEPNDRLSKFEDSINFTKRVFKEHLNVDFLLETWKSLDNKNGPSNGDLLRSQFISSHLRSLRMLVDEIGTSSTKSKSPNRPRAPSQDSEEDDGDDLKEIGAFINSIGEYDIAPDGQRLIVKDFQRMSKMQATSSDHQVLRTYLEVIMDLPWVKKTEQYSIHSVDIDLSVAKSLLDGDHYGMENVKERILEYLAVLKLHDNINKRTQLTSAQEEKQQKLKNDSETPFTQNHEQSVAKAPIMLLTGPPGVGKTSLAKSVATTLGRKFQRISVGGLNDFADLKGHRRTYVGAIPGLIIQALRKSQSMNPVILLDEVDKIGSNSRKGDPEAALLEILDPEQNISFQDHYIGFPIDLSQVLFICTSNDLWALSEPLRDRMEVIELSGYNYFEKVEICKRYLIPRQTTRNGLPSDALNVSDDIILKIALRYTREAGIRNLERLIGSICRSKAIEYSNLSAEGDDFNQLPKGYVSTVSESDLPRYIGIPPHLSDSDAFPTQDTKIQNSYGMVNGLSYNSDGSGSLLKFEMVGLPGNQHLTCTGRLGEVLMESSQIANTLVAFILNENLISGPDVDCAKLLERYNNLSIHLHVPEGAISKDGPSAGITMTLCLLSLISQRAVSPDLAMTGEITLTGKILPIGGVKEKLLGAHLTGKIKKVLLPRLNRKDIIEDFTRNIEDRVVANEILGKLIHEEEKVLRYGNMVSPYGEAESWIQEKLGIKISYVNDFSDVLKEVWDGDMMIKG